MKGASKSSGRRHRWLTKRGVQAIRGVEADPSKTGAGSRVYANPEIEDAASGDERTSHVPEKTITDYFRVDDACGVVDQFFHYRSR